MLYTGHFKHGRFSKDDKESCERRFNNGLYGFYGKDVCVLFSGSAYRLRVSTLPKQRSEEQEKGGRL